MKKFLKSFVYAGEGIRNAILTQRNLRIHITVMVYVISFSLFYELSRAEYAVLVLTFSSVIASEMINTAVENSVDLCSTEYSKLAKAAKDAAAGAVLTAAVFSVITGIILFFDTNVFKEIFRYYSENIPQLIGLAVSFPVSVLFITGKLFKDNERKENGDKK